MLGEKEENSAKEFLTLEGVGTIKKTQVFKCL